MKLWVKVRENHVAELTVAKKNSVVPVGCENIPNRILPSEEAWPIDFYDYFSLKLKRAG
jgi:hypothetical protein